MKALLRFTYNDKQVVTIANDDMRLTIPELQEWCDRMNNYLVSTGGDKRDAHYYLG